MRSLILMLMLIAAASIVSLTAQAAHAADEFGSPEDLLFQEIPVVISSTRTEQSLLDVPNAVTVITAAEIRESGAMSIIQMLAWVPGVELMRNAAGETVLSIRGFNNPATSRVLTMIDGRTVYQDFFGIVLTDHLNVAIDEIERVEVIRGPGSALYGANAFLGTINIITKSARDLPRAKLKLAGGPRNTIMTGVGAVSTDRLAIKGSFERNTIEHFRNKTSSFVNVATPHRRGEVAARAQKLNTTLEYKLSDDSELRLYGGVINLKSDLLTDVGTWNFDGPRYDVALDWDAGPWKFKTFLTHLDLDVRTIPPASSILPTAVPIPIRDRIQSTTLDFEMQRELQLGEHALLVGLNTRRLVTSAPVVLGAREAETLYAAFLQDEYSVNDWLTAFIGARFDEHPKSGLAISPRVSAVAKLGETSRLRFSLARSFRNPSQVQNYLTLTTHNPPPIPVVVNGFEDLDPEWVTAYEIGFASVLHPRLRASLDLFYNVVEDFQTLQVVGLALSWRNIDRTINRGAELSLDFQVNAAMRGFTTYSVQSAHGEHEGATPRHKASAGLRGTIGERTRYSLSGSLVGHTRFEAGPIAALPNRTISSRFSVDSFVGFEVLPGFELGLHARNLFHQVRRQHPLGDEIGSEFMISGSWEF